MTKQDQPAYRPRVGDTVSIKGRTETYGVIEVSDPSLVTLQNADGKTFRVGRLALELVKRGEWRAAG